MQGVLIVCNNQRRKVGGRLDVTFADEICEVAETQTTYITDELIDRQRRVKSCLGSPGKMAGEQ